VWHDAKEELPDNGRNVYAIGVLGGCGIYWRVANNSGWSTSHDIAFWRELPEPPRPATKIIPHSLAHWHDAKTTRPEGGKRVIATDTHSGNYWEGNIDSINWSEARTWTYAPENAQ
jgi:hypothetical protein